MFPDLIFDFVLEQLADEVQQHPTLGFAPLPTDSWIARSVMQKAIRRGMVDLACRAAAQLLLIDPRTLWRRLLVTALEDLGPAEVDTTARIVAAWRDRKWRSQIGGDWPVIAELVRRSALAIKCQAANDLWNIALHDPTLAHAKATLCEENEHGILDIAATPGEVCTQAVAALIALGQNAGCSAPTFDRAATNKLFDAFEASGRFSHVASVYREAHRLSGIPLAALNLCLWPHQQSLQSVARDELSATCWIGEIPSFALDQYTRTGKATIRRYALQSEQWRDFCGTHSIPDKLRAPAAGEILFRIEGAVVDQRRIDNQSAALLTRSAPLGCFMPPDAVASAKALIRRQLPLIDDIRRALLPSSGKTPAP